jgi:hypothetical protein
MRAVKLGSSDTEYYGPATVRDAATDCQYDLNRQ